MCLKQAISGDENVKLVYITPEKIIQSESIMNQLQKINEMKKLNRFVIDEAHCVSHWGQDFRKDYLELKVLKQ